MDTDDIFNLLFDGGDGSAFLTDVLSTPSDARGSSDSFVHGDPFGHGAADVLDTPTLDHLTEDLFAELLTGGKIDCVGGDVDERLETIDPDQLLSTPANESHFQSPASDSNFSFNESSNDFSPAHARSPEGSHSNSPDHTLLFPSTTPSHASSPFDHNYAGSEDGRRSPNSLVHDQAPPIFEAVDSSGDETDCGVDASAGFPQRLVDGEVFLLEDLAATEVVLTSGDQTLEIPSPAAASASPIFVKIVSPPSCTPNASSSPAVGYRLETPTATPSSTKLSRGGVGGVRSGSKRSFITVKTRPPGSSSSSSSSGRSGEIAEELRFNGEKRLQNYSRKAGTSRGGPSHRQQRQQQRPFARKVERPDASKFPRLELTDEERRLLEQEGITLPERLPLTKQEERSLKGIRRKIRNKQSALASRQKKKTYVDNLESRVKSSSEENQRLLTRVAQLEAQNGCLLTQLKRLQAAMRNANKPVHASTCVMVLLLSFALLLFPNLSPLEKSLPEEFKEMLKQQTMEDQPAVGPEGKTAVSTAALPGARSLLSAVASGKTIENQLPADLERMLAGARKVVEAGAAEVPKKEGERAVHDSLLALGSAGYIIDEDVDDDVGPPGKRRRLDSVHLNNDNKNNNETRDVEFVDVKPEVEALDLLVRNNAKKLGVKTYETGGYETRKGSSRRLLTTTTETNIIDF